jgi:hypothetical protein
MQASKLFDYTITGIILLSTISFTFWMVGANGLIAFTFAEDAFAGRR